MKIRFIVLTLAITGLLSGCYGVNSKTSEIGSFDWTCLTENDMREIAVEHSTENITDTIFKEGLEEVKNHFLKPKYILYFDESPQEIVGMDGNSIRAAFNPEIAKFAIDGLSPQLSDTEQVRIRNRVLRLVWKKECAEGKLRLEKLMKEPAVFSEAYYDR